MATSINEICENTKLAREMALMGNYESSGVYYQGVIQQIHRLLFTIDEPTRKSKWQSVQSEIAEEYEQVKELVNTLQLFKIDSNIERGIRGTAFNITNSAFEEPTKDPNAWFNNTLRDPDVWPPPPPRENDIWNSPTIADHRTNSHSRNSRTIDRRSEAQKKNQKSGQMAGKKIDMKSGRTIRSAVKNESSDKKNDKKTEKCDKDGKEKEKDEEVVERKFEGSGYDGDLVEMIGKILFSSDLKMKLFRLITFRPEVNI